ncbi:MAG: cytochrome c [Gemmatimonadetes bacterium]|nr:cytochrome c [Gemmatimonadota bacterium]
MRNAIAGLALLCACGPGEAPARVDAAVPAEHAAGEALFDAHCAACHGERATGSETGPPLVHRIYEPRHHGDAAFLLAVTRGVRAHHWRFGDMPAVSGPGPEDIERITGFVRWLQREAGIE